MHAPCGPTVLVVYHSQTGPTRAMADAVAAGEQPVDERFLVKACGRGARVVDVAPWSCCGTG
jgi:hypothetical protein